MLVKARIQFNEMTRLIMKVILISQELVDETDAAHTRLTVSDDGDT